MEEALGVDSSNQMIDEEEELYPNSVGDETKRDRPIRSSSEPLDIEAYASLYSGRSKISRLIFISDKVSGPAKMEALRMAHDEIRKGENTQIYREVVAKIDGKLGEEYLMDQAWADAVDRKADFRKERLENELNAYKTNMIKESIRMGYNDFGDFHYAHGALGDAFKSYIRTRDYCTTPKHLLLMNLNAILVSIEMGQFSHVTSYVTKAEQTQEALDPITIAKLRAASGLSQLVLRKYKQAARMFLEMGPELGNNYTEVIAAQDVAIYGGLCALATFDRTELKNKVIDNLNFRNYLELVPEVRELIQDFYSSHYASCLEYLENLKANLLLDIHLHEHVEMLYNQIRHKALIQYTLPFISVDLRMMANAFKTSISGLEKELETLITDNQVQARIDSHNKILYARHADQRNATFQRVLQTGREFDRDVRGMLIRANIIKHDHNSKGSRKF